jgi:hypothetical protein
MNQGVDSKIISFNNPCKRLIGHNSHLFGHPTFTVLSFTVCGCVMVKIISHNLVQHAVAKKFIPLPVFVGNMPFF